VVVVVVLVVQWGGLGAQRGLHYDPKRRSSSKKKVLGGCLGEQGGRSYPMTLCILVLWYTPKSRWHLNGIDFFCSSSTCSPRGWFRNSFCNSPDYEIPFYVINTYLPTYAHTNTHNYVHVSALIDSILQLNHNTNNLSCFVSNPYDSLLKFSDQ
jgi:hypothetical protein